MVDDNASPGADESIVRQPAPALLTLKLIRRLYVPLGERTIFRMMSAGKFPKADIASGGKIRLWRRETIQRWIDEKTGNLSNP